MRVITTLALCAVAGAMTGFLLTLLAWKMGWIR